MERGDEALTVIVRLDRTTQYAVTPGFITKTSYYWVTRFRG